MKNDRSNSQQKRITIKREAHKVSPVLQKFAESHFGGEDKTIHVRRHSVIVSNSRYGTVQRTSQECQRIDLHERFKSRDLAYPHSYQSSK